MQSRQQQEIIESKPEVFALLDHGYQLSNAFANLRMNNNRMQEVANYSAAFMNWFCNYFERDANPNMLMPVNRERDYVFLVTADVSRAYVSVRDTDVASVARYRTFDERPNSGIIDMLVAIVFSFLKDDTIEVSFETEDAREAAFFEAIRLALNYALWGVNVDRYDSVPSGVQLSEAFSRNVDITGKRRVGFANAALSIVLQALGRRTQPLRPRLLFYRDDPNPDVWSSVVYKNKANFTIPLFQGELNAEEEEEEDNAPDYNPNGMLDDEDIDDANDNESVAGEDDQGRRRLIGTKLEVWRGVAKRTKGGLRKGDLKRNKKCKVVSIKASEGAKERYRDPYDQGRSALRSWREAIVENGRRFPESDALGLRRSVMAFQ